MTLCSEMLESISEFVYERANTPMGLSCPRSKIIYHDGILVYEGWIDSWFTNVNKGVFLIIQGYVGVSELYL